MASHPETKFRVAICGGGIGGLAFALGLAQFQDIEINLYEATAQFKDIGAGIGIWGRGISALRRWNLEEEARKIATVEPGKYDGVTFELRRADQPVGKLIGYWRMSSNLAFHRSHLVEFLGKQLQETGRASIHFRKRCVSFIQRPEAKEDTVTLYFADGSSATCDVLVGCDGIKSAVRGELLEPSSQNSTKHTEEQQKSSRDPLEDPKRFINTKFCGTVAYRTLINPEDLRAIDPQHSILNGPGRKVYLGKNRHIVVYPVGGGRFLNFLGYSSDPTRQEEWMSHNWVAEAEHEELAQYFQGFEPEAQTLVKCVNKSSRWAMYDLESLPFWTKGNVTLLGDAAHATTPFLGSGGGQVLEDAYVLSRLLGSKNTTKTTLPYVLQAYEIVRKPRADKVIQASLRACRAFEFMKEYATATDDTIVATIREVTEWLWEGNGDSDDDVLAAEKLIQELMVV